MEALTALLSGFGVALQPMNLLWGFVGVTLGTFVGVLPGVGPALTVAMLLPLTVKLDPTGALIAVIGDDNDDFILIGLRREFIAQRDGVLFLGVNEGDLTDNTGSYDIVIEAEASGR